MLDNTLERYESILRAMIDYQARYGVMPTQDYIAHEVCLSRVWLNHWLGRMVEDKYLRRHGHGRYVITALGQSLVLQKSTR